MISTTQGKLTYNFQVEVFYTTGVVRLCIKLSSMCIFCPQAGPTKILTLKLFGKQPLQDVNQSRLALCVLGCLKTIGCAPVQERLFLRHLKNIK